MGKERGISRSARGELKCRERAIGKQLGSGEKKKKKKRRKQVGDYRGAVEGFKPHHKNFGYDKVVVNFGKKKEKDRERRGGWIRTRLYRGLPRSQNPETPQGEKRHGRGGLESGITSKERRVMFEKGHPAQGMVGGNEGDRPTSGGRKGAQNNSEGSVKKSYR